jgi:hypothetical protein
MAAVRYGAMSEGAMNEGRYSWEPAVLNAFTAAPETVAAKIESAKQAIADRLKDQTAPDASETSTLMYALEALDTLGALGLLIDPTSKDSNSEGSTSKGPSSKDPTSK